MWTAASALLGELAGSEEENTSARTLASLPMRPGGLGGREDVASGTLGLVGRRAADGGGSSPHYGLVHRCHPTFSWVPMGLVTVATSPSLGYVRAWSPWSPLPPYHLLGTYGFGHRCHTYGFGHRCHPTFTWVPMGLVTVATTPPPPFSWVLAVLVIVATPPSVGRFESSGALLALAAP